jgi:hypothetical protein
MNSTARQGSGLARLAVALAATWLGIGALFKLFAGTPNLLPAPIRDHSPFDWDLTFRLVIPIELTLVWIGYFAPRLGWWMLAALFVLFEVLLAQMVAAGEKSCGCLGNAVSLPPAVMMAIDGVLLLGMLATRPWSKLPRGTSSKSIAAIVVLSAVSWALPWIVIPSSSATNVVPPSNGTSTSPSGTGTPGASVPTARYILMTPEKWKGQSIYDVAELTAFVPADKLPTDGVVVLWRQACDHCAKHLREMASSDKGAQPIVMVQLQDDLEQTRAVDSMPQGAHVAHYTTPSGVAVTVETPWEIHVAGGVVTEVVLTK